MTQAKEPRIVIRVTPDEWERYDDKRHSERTSFQQLGARLLRQWFEGVPLSEQPTPAEATCPQCSSVLRVGGDSTTLELVRPGVPQTEQVKLSSSERALIERGVGRISDVEIRWLLKTLYVFRKGPLRTVAALMTNLDTFEEHTEVMMKEAYDDTEDASEDRDAEIERIEQLMDEEEALGRSSRKAGKSRGPVGKGPSSRAS